MPLKGVYPATRKDNTKYYRGSITYRGRHISLGSYDTEIACHRAYIEAGSILEDSAFTLSDIESPEYQSLPFNKKICLLNFRDNGLYIANPIYLYRKFFLYYLSVHRILKFDRDDLFYYSSHKIMERGGRLFVSEYGMQTGINTRYGIKPYAVEGKDYRFVNGDRDDYRYENIHIINTYNGVESFNKKGKLFYKARIHINGNVIIGTYDTDVEAAVAYNKAIDRLSQKGIHRAYVPNYITGLKPDEYWELYKSVALSEYFD